MVSLAPMLQTANINSRSFLTKLLWLIISFMMFHLTTDGTDLH
jgi:hypothetical protein